MTHDAEVTRLGATNLGSEVPGRAQQGSLGGVDVVRTSASKYLVPRSAPQILATSSAPSTLARSSDNHATNTDTVVSQCRRAQ